MVADRRDIMSGGIAPDTLFSTLGSAHCWEVLECLLRHSCTVSEIACALQLDMSEISRSLRRLDALGLVEHHQFKKYRMYAVAARVQCARDGSSLRLTIQTTSAARLSIALAIQ